MLGAAVIFAVAVLGARIQRFLPPVRLPTRHDTWLGSWDAALQAIELQRLVGIASNSRLWPMMV